MTDELLQDLRDWFGGRFNRFTAASMEAWLNGGTARQTAVMLRGMPERLRGRVRAVLLPELRGAVRALEASNRRAVTE